MIYISLSHQKTKFPIPYHYLKSRSINQSNKYLYNPTCHLLRSTLKRSTTTTRFFSHLTITMPVFGRNRHEHFHGSPGLVGPGDVYDSRRPGAFGSGDMLDPYHPSYNRAHVAEPDGHYHYSEHHHSEYHYERHVHRSQGGRSRNAQKRAKARGKAEGYAEGMAVGFQEGWVQAVNGQEMHDRDLGFDARRLLDQEPWQSSSERRHGAVWGMYETPPPSYHSSRAPSPVGGAMCPYQEPPRGRRGPPVR